VDPENNITINDSKRIIEYLESNFHQAE
jgi:hypothetical protein